MFKELEQIIAKQLSTNRFEHVLRVANLCSELASKYHVDVESAYLAGLLHDISKEKSINWQKKKLKENNLCEKDIYLEQNIWHAYTAKALICELNLEFSKEIELAIENHIEGTTTLDELSMILFIADMLEPKRNFDNIDELRIKDFETLVEMYQACFLSFYKYINEENYYITTKTKLAKVQLE